ncbi:MAG: RDD family protein [Planctomycetaceae bacterium]|nr:RDD family protein [Planctomycetales bacterium]MCB9874986.1 RDD family protein [Planctomycetaceae bacterium]HRX78662.1 RDD family protein [Pirellulaceae bacterium]
MQSENPYAAPEQISPIPQIVQDAGKLQIASQGKRFLNFILDSVVTQIVSGMAGLALGVAYGISRAAQGAPITPEDEAMLQIVGMLVGFAVSIVYFVFTEALFQRSFAKFLTGTMVVREDGGRPSFGQILGRTLCRFIPFEPFSFFGGQGFPVGWHDSISGTRVISTR